MASGSLAVAFALVASAAGCKSEQARDTERSAERVRAKSADLQHEQEELGKAVREGARELVDELGDVGEKQRQLEQAARDFEQRRAQRIHHVEGQFAILQGQPELISRLASHANLTAGDRVKLDEKLQVLRVRIDEAKLLVSKLHTASAADWTGRDDEVARALRRIDKARDEALDVIEDSDGRSGS